MRNDRTSHYALTEVMADLGLSRWAEVPAYVAHKPSIERNTRLYLWLLGIKETRDGMSLLADRLAVYAKVGPLTVTIPHNDKTVVRWDEDATWDTSLVTEYTEIARENVVTERAVELWSEAIFDVRRVDKVPEVRDDFFNVGLFRTMLIRGPEKEWSARLVGSTLIAEGKYINGQRLHMHMCNDVYPDRVEMFRTS